MCVTKLEKKPFRTLRPEIPVVVWFFEPSSISPLFTGGLSNKFLQDALRREDNNKKVKPPKPPKQPNIRPFQFHAPRLAVLLEKERLSYQKSIHYRVPMDSTLPEAEAEVVRAREQEKVDTSEPLTEEELEQKESLLNKGFDWSKKEFNAFLDASEKFGRNDIQNIISAVPNKSPEEVRYPFYDAGLVR